MLRAMLALTLLVSAVEARGRQTVGEAVDVYLAGGREPLPVVAAAGGGVLGWVSVDAGIWYPSLDGDIASSGERVDLRDDLALDDNELTVQPRLHLSLGGLGIRADAFFLEFEGDGNVTRSFDFGGVTFTFSENVRSDVRIDNYRVLLTLKVVDVDVFTLWLQSGLSYFRLEATVVGETAGNATASADVPIPVVGGLARIDVGGWIVELDVTGFGVEYGDIEGALLDVQVTVGREVLKVLAIRVGYRLVAFDGGDEDFDLDASLDGVFGEISVTF